MPSAWFSKELLKVRGSLYGFTLSLVRDFDLAEEAFQEVCVRILEREDEFEQGTDFGAWARAFARRTVLEELRRKGRIRLSAEAVESVAARYDSREDRSRERREALRKCISELDGALRHLIDLRYDDGLSMSQIGERLGRSAGAVQVALSRARASLLQCVERRLAEGVQLGS